MLSDRLRRAELVLADGRVLTCDENHDADLFWALRGAGGARFGVVTSLEFETVAAPPSTAFETGGVYPNFPEPGLDDWGSEYHAGNRERLLAVKRRYDPDDVFGAPPR